MAPLWVERVATRSRVGRGWSDEPRLADHAAVLDERLGTERLAAARTRGRWMAAPDALAWARAEIDRTLAAIT